nr:MAG TPA: hypothetical protein [Caudoviricetes sp.]
MNKSSFPRSFSSYTYCCKRSLHYSKSGLSLHLHKQSCTLRFKGVSPTYVVSHHKPYSCCLFIYTVQTNGIVSTPSFF